MGYLAILLSAVFAGFNISLIKLALNYAPPVTLLAIRFIIATAMFSIPYYFRYKERNTKVEKDLILLSTLLPLALLFIFFGIERTTASTTQTLLIFIPIIVSLLASSIVKEKIKGFTIAGLFVSLIGVRVLSVSSEESALGDSTILGIVFVLLAALTTALYLVYSKRLSKKYRAGTVTFYTFITGTIVFSVMSLLKYLLGETLTYQALDLNFALYLGYIITFGTISSFYLLQYGIPKVSSTFAGLTNYFQVPFGIMAGVTLLGEVLTEYFWLGTGLILAGALLTMKKENGARGGT